MCRQYRSVHTSTIPQRQGQSVKSWHSCRNSTGEKLLARQKHSRGGALYQLRKSSCVLSKLWAQMGAAAKCMQGMRQPEACRVHAATLHRTEVQEQGDSLQKLPAESQCVRVQIRLPKVRVAHLAVLANRCSGRFKSRRIARQRMRLVALSTATSDVTWALAQTFRFPLLHPLAFSLYGSQQTAVLSALPRQP